jgi:hypothetical protein
MKSIQVQEAFRDLARIVVEVISRDETIQVSSSWGAVTVIPKTYLSPWVPLADNILSLVEPFEVGFGVVGLVQSSTCRGRPAPFSEVPPTSEEQDGGLLQCA